MASITDIKRRILELAPAPFQEFCDVFLSKKGYGAVHGYGMKSGTGNTTIGNPDTYFRKENGKYVFVVYTIQQTDIYSKIKEDIEKCFDSSKTGLDVSNIEEIVCCHTSSNLSAGADKKLHELCETKGIVLTIYGIDEIAVQVHNRYRSLAKNYLGLSIDTNQILTIEEFVIQCDANGMSAPLNTSFQFRNKEKEEIKKGLEKNSVVVVTGKAGVGKTRLVLETIDDFSRNKGYKLLCVKNNNLGLYEDLVSVTEQPGKYLFFIDDANELAELGQILAYITKGYLNYQVKIIVTVRDYAKASVIQEIKKFTIPKILEISSFTDDEIKEFLNKNLGITNEIYVNQIIRIAEGNPRIAYMAGKLAVEEQRLDAIRDVSQLYDAYYAKYVDSTLGEDEDLCFVVGILSVINAIVLNNMNVIQKVLDDYGITTEEFIKKIYQLARLEFVEIKLDQVATLSDQCLANYMLYYVFFQKKVISLSKILLIGYKYFRNGVIQSIKTILNIFESQETRDYCKKEIIKVWDKLQKDNDNCYEQFAKDFHVFRPEEAFLLAQQKVDGIDKENFDLEVVDFRNDSYCPEASILELLTGYQSTDYMEYVMEILLSFCEKNEKTMVSGYRWLENYYGMEITANKEGYNTQKKICQFLYDKILSKDETAIVVGAQLAIYSLKFQFQGTEMGRGNTIVFYNLELKESKELREYRDDCWKMLITVAARRQWQDKMIIFLNEYARNLYEKPDRKIVEGDRIAFEKFLAIIDCKRISFLKGIEELLYNAKKININYNKKWKKKLSGDIWKLYKLLDNDFVHSDFKYEEYEDRRNAQIIECGQKIQKREIKQLVQSVNEILADELIKDESYAINQGLELLVQQFTVEYLYEFINVFIEYGNCISINPWVVLALPNRTNDPEKLFSILKKAEFPQKNEWMFGFYNTLQENKINSKILKEFLIYLQDDSDKLNVTFSYRSLRVLDKFLIIEPNIYPIVCSIIYKKRKYSSFIVKSYFMWLFNEKAYSPQELITLFKNDLDILQNIYFFVLKNEKGTDYTGIFLKNFLLLGESWLEKYADVFFEDKYIEYNIQRNNVLWKMDDYIMIFDYLFTHIPKDKASRWRTIHNFSRVLENSESDEVIKLHQKEWIKHIIIRNSFTDQIYIIFEIVCELSETIRKQAIKNFVEINSDYNVFKNLQLLPRYGSSDGGLVSCFQKQIDFLESLYSIVSGMKYLKHRTRIKELIECLKERIKYEEVNEICGHLYM